MVENLIIEEGQIASWDGKTLISILENHRNDITGETLYNHSSSSKNLVLLHHLLNPLELLMVQLQNKKLHPSDAMLYALMPKM
uniref:Uncharacterized protein n=1 Tax=Romanomermis culicivorax TaxID=13658 RepID=A0A915KR29_ROMCU